MLITGVDVQLLQRAAHVTWKPLGGNIRSLFLICCIGINCLTVMVSVRVESLSSTPSYHPSGPPLSAPLRAENRAQELRALLGSLIRRVLDPGHQSPAAASRLNG